MLLYYHLNLLRKIVFEFSSKNLGVKNVDLYCGTRHTTASALDQHFTSEELRNYGTMHGVNKAFDRYIQGEKRKKSRFHKKYLKFEQVGKY